MAIATTRPTAPLQRKSIRCKTKRIPSSAAQLPGGCTRPWSRRRSDRLPLTHFMLWREIRMPVRIRKYKQADIPDMVQIWNEIVEEGIAFPQEELLDENSGKAFFDSQTYCAVAEDMDGKLYGLYILHPNNVGRCGHICNASYAVRSDVRGMHIGEKLVKDCLIQGKAQGFRILQFNAVVATNVHARHLYERLGFQQLGVIPGGYRLKDGHYEDICPFYRSL